MNIVYVANVNHVHNVYLRSHVGDVYLAEISVAMVIPGKKWIAWAQREPYLNVCVGAAHESYQSRRIYRPYSDQRRFPGPIPSANRPVPSVRSGREQIPRARLQPRSSPMARPTPSGRSDTAPSLPALLMDTIPARTADQDLPIGRDWSKSSISRRILADRYCRELKGSR